MTNMVSEKKSGQKKMPVRTHERRTGRRITITPGQKLPVAIRCGQGTVCRGRVVNVSTKGMLVEFPKGQLPPVKTYAKVSVKLQYLGDCIWLPGQVRHCVGQKMGFYFPDLTDEPKARTKHPLAVVLHSLSLFSPLLRIHQV